MMNWHRRWSTFRVSTLLLSATLLSNVAPLLAQDPIGDGYNTAKKADSHTEKIAIPHQNLTRDQAAKEFSSFLNDVSQLDKSPSSFQQIMDSVSSKTKRDLDYKLRPLFRVMSLQWKQSNRVIQMQSEGDKTATATTKNAHEAFILPLVLVEENGGWGIDIVETYARWNGLEGSAKADAIYNLTGVMLDGLPRTEHMIRGTCQSHLKLIALGIAQYLGDSNEKYPSAKNWMDVLQPYVLQESVFTCPSLHQNQHYGYAYNSKLSTKAFTSLSAPKSTVTVYETTMLKRNAYGVGENSAFRHQDGANYAFADGHVKWFAKGQTPSFHLKP